MRIQSDVFMKHDLDNLLRALGQSARYMTGEQVLEQVRLSLGLMTADDHSHEVPGWRERRQPRILAGKAQP